MKEHQDKQQELKPIQEKTTKNNWRLSGQKDFVYYFDRFKFTLQKNPLQHLKDCKRSCIPATNPPAVPKRHDS